MPQCRGPVALRDGDEIQIGFCTKLMFIDEETTESIEYIRVQPGLQIDQSSRSLTINGVKLIHPLSPPPLGLLKVLVEADGEIVSRDKMVNKIWPTNSYNGVSEQAIDAVVRRVRIRIRELDAEHSYIETVRGHGFRFVQQYRTLRRCKHPVRGEKGQSPLPP